MTFFGKAHQTWIDALVAHDMQPAWPDIQTEFQSVGASAEPLRNALKRQKQSLEEVDRLYDTALNGPRGLRGRLALIWARLPIKIIAWERKQEPLQNQFDLYHHRLAGILFRAMKDQLVTMAHQASELGLTEDVVRVDWGTASRQLALLQELGRQLGNLESILADFGSTLGKNAVDWFRTDPKIVWWYAHAVRAIKATEQTCSQHPKDIWDRGAIQLESQERMTAELQHPLVKELMEVILRTIYGEYADALLISGGRFPDLKGWEESWLNISDGPSWKILMKVLNDPIFAVQSMLFQPQQRLRLEQVFALHYEPSTDSFSLHEADLVKRLDAIWGPEITHRFMETWRAEYPIAASGQASLPLRAA